MDTLLPLLIAQLEESSTQDIQIGGFENLDLFERVVAVDQTPIGRTPRSNPVTYCGILGIIRDFFQALPLSKARGYGKGHFSFNVPGGRCEKCEGDGLQKVEMQLMADVYVTCPSCEGSRFRKEVLEITYKNHSIAQVLNLSVDEASEFFSAIPILKRKLNILQKVGLGYLKLGQSSTTLSGGEAQRLKLSKELSKKATGKTLYIFDEPTTGLHFKDIQNLLDSLSLLCDQGHTIIVIEHNSDFIRSSDYVIDIGPGAGETGGTLVAIGSPKEISKNKKSFTGQYLKF